MPNTWTGPTIEDNKFKYSYTADQAQTSGYTIKLATENKFVDKDIWVKVKIPSGSLTAGNGSVALTNHGATNLLGAAATEPPSSGHYLQITGNGTVSSTAGWIANGTSETSNNATKYYPVQSAVINFGTESNANKIYCTTSGYIAADTTTPILSITAQTPTTSYSHSNTMGTYFNSGSSSDYDVIISPQYSNSAGYVVQHSNTTNGGIGYWKIKTTSVKNNNVTSISGTTVTRATATWQTGWITAGSISAAVFSNSGTTNTTYIDISDTTEAPVLTSGDYLYINRGYVDNLKISLAKLIPDSAVKPAGATSYSQGLLSGYALYDGSGNLVNGSINTITLPSSSSSSATNNYTEQATIYATTADQYLNIPSGFNSTNGYYKINKLTSTNYSAGNIKHNVTISVNNGSSNVYSVTGTFTSSSTATSTNGAAGAAQILKNYGAWVNGSEITGTIESRSWPTTTASSATSGYSGTTFNTSTSNRYINLPSGYYSANKYYLIRAVTTSGISAANIKYNAVVKVGDSADDDRITGTITGTFTSSSTVSTGQTAITNTSGYSGEMLSGYSAWVNGAEVKGSIETYDGTFTTG